MPDTFDLDALFAHLESDIAGASSPRGAAQSMRTARRRRRTTVGAAAAVAVLAIGGATIGHTWWGGDHEVTPADHLPAAAPLDDTTLTAATAGWTPAWTAGTKAARDKEASTFGGACLPHQIPGGPNAVIVPFGNAHGDLAMEVTGGTFARADEVPDAWRSVQHDVAHCSDATLVSSFSLGPGAGGQTYRIAPAADDTQPEYLWIVSTGRSIGELKILGQEKRLAPADDRPIADALLGDLLARDAVTPVAQPIGPQRIDPRKTAGEVWAPSLAPALAGWPTPWNPHPPTDSGDADLDLALPSCVGSLAGNDSGNGLTVNVGTDGYEEVHWFHAQATAVQAIARIEQSLVSCSTPYAVHTVTLPSGRPVVVAAGPQVVLWFTRVASHVLVLQLPAGDVPPPDDVSVKVGQVIEHVLEQPATTTASPDDHTKVPAWLQKEITAAPTFGP